MRIIIFKAKSLETGEWVEGDLINCENGEKIIIHGGGEDDWEPVDPATVCQFTGLLDSKGVRIFEGDKVECNGHYVTSKTCGLPHHNIAPTITTHKSRVSTICTWNNSFCSFNFYAIAENENIVSDVNEREMVVTGSVLDKDKI